MISHGIGDRLAFGMWHARALMPSTTDDLTLFHQHRTDRRIWRRPANPLARFIKRQAHPMRVVHPRIRSLSFIFPHAAGKIMDDANSLPALMPKL
jgi:hypothetical protein